MTTLEVVPEGLLALSARVDALAARLIAENVRHATQIAATAPPAADPVSIKTALGLQLQGAEHNTAAAMGNEELARSGLGIAEAAGSYLRGDAFGAAATGAVAL